MKNVIKIVLGIVGFIPVLIGNTAFTRALSLPVFEAFIVGSCFGVLYAIAWCNWYFRPRTSLRESYRNFLAKVRAWIDRRLPRDVLRVTIYAIVEGDRIKPLYSGTHMEAILGCKMMGGPSTMKYGAIVVTLSTEHLTP